MDTPSDDLERWADGEVEDHLVTISASPTGVFVDDEYAGLPPGTQIADADPSTPGNQPAIVGFNAFATIQQAIDVAPAGGQVGVNPGTYKENLTIADKDLGGAAAWGVILVLDPVTLAEAGGSADGLREEVWSRMRRALMAQRG